MPRTLPHSIREIADQIDRPEWASVLWRAAKQLEMMYGCCGIQPDEIPQPSEPMRPGGHGWIESVQQYARAMAPDEIKELAENP